MNRCTPQLLNSEWLPRLAQFTRLIVGFSGGLDSTVLLHVLASHSTLRTKLVAVHVNHGISPHASSWQIHCKQFCQNLGIEFLAESVQFDRSANIEERARNARYAVFSSLVTDEDCLLLGHHQDDQAETVLLQLIRGTGIDGLSAMAEFSCLEAGELARPFLHHSRKQLEQYAMEHELSWIEDESNLDIHYSRNYLRQKILPLLIDKWPAVKANIARTAFHCQQAQNNLDALAINDCQDLMALKNSLPFESLRHLDFERIANILRVWLKNNQVKLPSTATLQRLIHEMIFARADAVPEVRWGNILVHRYKSTLYLDTKRPTGLLSSIEWSSFPDTLVLEELGFNLYAKRAEQGLVITNGVKLSIKFRQGGEVILWHGQHKPLKKLFQEWEVPPWHRERIPLLYINDELAAVVGYAVSDLFFKKNSQEAWLLFIT